MGACCSKKPKYEPPTKKSAPPTTENMRALQQQQQQQQQLQRQREEQPQRESDLEFNSVVPSETPTVDCCDLDLERCTQTTVECATYTCTHVSICVMDVATDVADMGCTVVQECCKEDEDRPPTTPMRYLNKNNASNPNSGVQAPKGTTGGYDVARKASREGSVVGLGNLPLYNQNEDNDGNVEQTQSNVTRAPASKVRSGSVPPAMLVPTSSVQTYDQEEHFNPKKNIRKSSISKLNGLSKTVDATRRKSA